MHTILGQDGSKLRLPWQQKKFHRLIIIKIKCTCEKRSNRVIDMLL